MIEHENPPTKWARHVFWTAGLLLPLVALILWDRMPRFQAARQLREAGIALEGSSVHRAVTDGHLPTLKLLHRARVPLDALAGPEGAEITPLIAAIDRGDLPIAEFLLGNVDCDQPGADGLAPLAHAVSRGRLDIVKRLLLRVKEPNVYLRTEEGTSEPILFAALRQRDLHLLRLLLTHPRLEVDVRDPQGMTPLHHAVASGNVMVLQALFAGSRNPDPAAALPDGTTPLRMAVEARHFQAVELLLQHQAFPNHSEEARALLCSAVEKDDHETLTALLAHGADPQAEHPEHSVSLLHLALDRSQTGCVLAFLQAGASPDGILRQAMECGQGLTANVVAAFLSEKGKQWAHQEGLLELAITGGSPRSVDLLLDHGADPNELTSIGQSALTLSLALRKPRLVKRLLESGADPDRRLQDPPTQVFLNHFAGDAKTLYYVSKDSGLTPLMLAALTEQEEAAAHLLTHGASRNLYSNVFRRYAVAFAAERDNVPIMQMILGRAPNDESRKVVVSLKKQQAVMYVDGQPANTSRVSTGRAGNRTPKGTFVITNKHRHHNSSIYGSSMPYFMRLSCGDFGLHYSPSVPSYPASHGCIRMPWSKAQQFYGTLQVGDIVVIE